MNAKNKRLYKDVLRMLIAIVASIILCKYSKGSFSLVMVAAALIWALTGAYGKALSCFAFFPFLAVMNSFLLPKPEVLGVAIRFGPLLIGLCMVLFASNRSAGHRLPLGSLFIYLGCAVISSIGGWCAKISFLKLVYFIFYILGIWIGTQNLQNRAKDIQILRSFFLALTVVIVFGSVMTLPFPTIAYPLDIRLMEVLKNEGIAAAEVYFDTREQTMNLLAGVTFHSQTLAPLVTISFVIVLLDMMLIERRTTLLHLSILIVAPIILFMTRSRTGLFSFAVGLAMVLLYAVRRLNTSYDLRVKIKGMAMVGMTILVIALAGLEATDHTVTKWLRKTDDISGDTRKLGTALTESRMGLAELSMDEFKRNPFLGMGFQVNFETQQLFGNRPGLVLSAPIEKGLLPLMILGEGGVVGVIAFLIFLSIFYSNCARKKYIATITMFTTFLATNIGEATFFSPGGAGGIMWMMCMVGGFTLDTIILYRRQIEQKVLYIQ